MPRLSTNRRRPRQAGNEKRMLHLCGILFLSDVFLSGGFSGRGVLPAGWFWPGCLPVGFVCRLWFHRDACRPVLSAGSGFAGTSAGRFCLPALVSPGRLPAGFVCRLWFHRDACRPVSRSGCAPDVGLFRLPFSAYRMITALMSRTPERRLISSLSASRW